ncbi:MAG: nitroreductase [Kosmotoga sp.]|nr:MAG: nitroreductase [Kosmotoga sp.]
MNFEKLYETIFVRKSVRKFSDQLLDNEKLTFIRNAFNGTRPFLPSIDIDLKIVPRNSVKGLLMVKAPHYLLFFSENKPGYLLNTGFILQQIDLFLSSVGLGSCWLGLTKPKKVFPETSSLEFVIALATGNPEENLYRKNISEFNRKPLEQIRKGDKFEDIIEAARLAPSATNSQPWFFITNNNSIHCYCIKPGLLKRIIYKKMNKIDMGISLCHLWLAALNKKFGINFHTDPDAKRNSPDDYYYVKSILLKQ